MEYEQYDTDDTIAEFKEIGLGRTDDIMGLIEISGTQIAVDLEDISKTDIEGNSQSITLAVLKKTNDTLLDLKIDIETVIEEIMNDVDKIHEKETQQHTLEDAEKIFTSLNLGYVKDEFGYVVSGNQNVWVNLKLIVEEANDMEETDLESIIKEQARLTMVAIGTDLIAHSSKLETNLRNTKWN